MKNFRQILEEVNYTISVMMLFDTILTALIIFLACYMVLSLFNLNGYYGLVPAIGMFIWEIIKRLRKNKLKMVENSYESLQEKLITAKDYLYAKNPFIDDLQEEIKESIKNVHTDSFFNEKKTYTKTGIIVGLCILMLLIAPYHIILFDFNKAVTDIQKRSDNTTDAPVRVQNNNDPRLVSVEDDWYGEFSIGSLGDDEMQIQLIETNYKLTSEIVEDPEKKKFQDIYPGEVSASRASAYNANVARDDQEIVKNYFKEISK